MRIRIRDYIICDASGNFMYQIKLSGLKPKVVSATKLMLYYDDKYIIYKFNGNFLWLIER